MTLIIVLITSAVSLLAFSNHRLMDQLIFNPFVTRVRKEWYRFLSCGLLHADFFHLLVNMYVLYSFGQMVESYYGLCLVVKELLCLYFFISPVLQQPIFLPTKNTTRFLLTMPWVLQAVYRLLCLRLSCSIHFKW